MANATRLKKAFTIAEMLIVIVVISILAGVTFAGYKGSQARAANTEAMNDAVNIADRLELAYIKNKKYPSDLSELGQLKKSPTTSLTYEATDYSFCMTITNLNLGTKTYTARNSVSVNEGNCGGWIGSTTPPAPEGQVVAPPVTPPASIPAPGASSVSFTTSRVKLAGGEFYQRYIVTTSGGNCSQGSKEWKIGVTGGATPSWSSVSWQTSNTRTIDVPEYGIYSPVNVTIFAKPRCVSGVNSTEGSAVYTYNGVGGGSGGAI